MWVSQVELVRFNIEVRAFSLFFLRSVDFFAQGAMKEGVALVSSDKARYRLSPKKVPLRDKSRLDHYKLHNMNAPTWCNFRLGKELLTCTFVSYAKYVNCPLPYFSEVSFI